MSNLENTSADERVRITHALERLERTIFAVRIALADEMTPIGFDATQAMTQTANDIAVHAAAADMALRIRGKP